MRSAALLTGLICAYVSVQAAPPAQTVKIVTAANAFLDTLSPQQRQSVVYAFDDEQQRARWSNFPIGMVRRGA